MSKKVFMIFNDKFDKHKQAYWFVKSFIKEEYQDLKYLFGVGVEMVKEARGMACNRDNDDWVWLSEHTIRGYTRGMTQVYYEQKDLGEI